MPTNSIIHLRIFLQQYTGYDLAVHARYLLQQADVSTVHSGSASPVFKASYNGPAGWNSEADGEELQGSEVVKLRPSARMQAAEQAVASVVRAPAHALGRFCDSVASGGRGRTRGGILV